MTEYITKDQGLAALREYQMGGKTAKEIICAIPAADVRPVARGRWLPTSDANKKRCSVCDVIHLIAQYPHGEANYCPNCGADMREES